jgi:Raf kinase inhibitor-like YbhB/YbcL family protein
VRRLLGILLGLILTSNVMAAGTADEFTISSSAFKDMAAVPVLYGCDGKNTSPPLSWTNPPAGTKSFVLTLDSPDWLPQGVYLWVLFNIPADTKSLLVGADSDLPQGINTGNNYYDEMSYRGPCPLDKNAHHYIFTLYALDTALDLEDGAKIEDVMHEIKHHTLGIAVLTGMYSHPIRQSMNTIKKPFFHSNWLSH